MTEEGAETVRERYRGIPVPEDLRTDGAPRTLYAAWKRGVDEVLNVMRPAVESLRYADECSFDHHGYCQAHGHLEPGPCPDGAARELLEKTRKDGDPS